MKITAEQIKKNFKNPWRDSSSLRDVRKMEDVDILAAAIIEAIVKTIKEQEKR